MWSQGEAIMKRVGARMRNKELYTAVLAWGANWRWAKENAAQDEIANLRMQMAMAQDSSFSGAIAMLKGCVSGWDQKSLKRVLRNWIQGAKHAMGLIKGQKRCARIVRRWCNRELADAFASYKGNFQSHLANNYKGQQDKVMRRTVRRWSLFDYYRIMANFTANYRVSRFSDAVDTAAQVKWDTQIESLNMIINIVHRWNLKVAGRHLIAWKHDYLDATRAEKNKAQTNSIMRIVVKRIVEIGMNHNLDMKMMQQLIQVFQQDDSMLSGVV